MTDKKILLTWYKDTGGGLFDTRSKNLKLLDEAVVAMANPKGTGKNEREKLKVALLRWLIVKGNKYEHWKENKRNNDGAVEKLHKFAFEIGDTEGESDDYGEVLARESKRDVMRLLYKAKIMWNIEKTTSSLTMADHKAQSNREETVTAADLNAKADAITQGLQKQGRPTPPGSPRGILDFMAYIGRFLYDWMEAILGSLSSIQEFLTLCAVHLKQVIKAFLIEAATSLFPGLANLKGIGDSIVAMGNAGKKAGQYVLGEIKSSALKEVFTKNWEYATMKTAFENVLSKDLILSIGNHTAKALLSAVKAIPGVGAIAGIAKGVATAIATLASIYNDYTTWKRINAALINLNPYLPQAPKELLNEPIIAAYCIAHPGAQSSMLASIDLPGGQPFGLWLQAIEGSLTKVQELQEKARTYLAGRRISFPNTGEVFISAVIEEQARKAINEGKKVAVENLPCNLQNYAAVEAAADELSGKVGDSAAKRIKALIPDSDETRLGASMGNSQLELNQRVIEWEGTMAQIRKGVVLTQPKQKMSSDLLRQIQIEPHLRQIRKGGDLKSVAAPRPVDTSGLYQKILNHTFLGERALTPSNVTCSYPPSAQWATAVISVARWKKNTRVWFGSRHEDTRAIDDAIEAYGSFFQTRVSMQQNQINVMNQKIKPEDLGKYQIYIKDRLERVQAIKTPMYSWINTKQAMHERSPRMPAILRLQRAIAAEEGDLVPLCKRFYDANLHYKKL